MLQFYFWGMIYKEDLLQFIWEKYIFEDKRLMTVCGKTLTIKSRGSKNLDQGPDFVNARIILDDTEWAGNIEIHLTTSEWMHHGHSNDANYKKYLGHGAADELAKRQTSTPKGLIGADEVARVVLFLISPQSGNITGEVISI